MKTVRYMFVMLVMAVVFGGVSAQDVPPQLDCTQDDYLWLQGRVNEISAQFADIVTYDPILTATQLRATMDAVQFACARVFTNTTNPDGIIGPIDFDGTLYEVTFVALPTEGASFDVGGSVTTETVSGDCGMLNLILVTSSDPDETDLFRFGNDCVAMFEVNRTGDWQLSFVKLQ